MSFLEGAESARAGFSRVSTAGRGCCVSPAGGWLMSRQLCRTRADGATVLSGVVRGRDFGGVVVTVCGVIWIVRWRVGGLTDVWDIASHPIDSWIDVFGYRQFLRTDTSVFFATAAATPRRRFCLHKLYAISYCPRPEAVCPACHSQ